MKLRNKLIPLISIATVATTVAPIATSCGNVGTDSVAMIDVLNGYIPSTGRAEGATNLTKAAVQDLYYEAVKGNPEIFTNDLAWYEGIVLKTRMNYGSSLFRQEIVEDYGLTPNSYTTLNPKTAKFGVSDIQLNQVEMVNPSTLEKEKINTISMRFNYEYEYDVMLDAYHNISTYQATRNVKLSYESTYTNIPFEVAFDSYDGLWDVRVLGYSSSDQWILSKLQDWSFEFKLSSITNDTITDYDHNVDTYTYDESEQGSANNVAQVQKWMDTIYSKDVVASNENEKNPFLNDDVTAVADSYIETILFNFGSYYLYDVMGPRWATDYLGYDDSDYYDLGEYTDENGNKTMSLLRLYGTTYNISYKEYENDKMPKSIKSNWGTQITSKLIPVYYYYSETTEPTCYIKLSNDLNTEMLYDTYDYSADIVITVQLCNANGTPINVYELPGVASAGTTVYEWLRAFINNYSFTLPAGSYSVSMTLEDESTASSYIPLENDILIPWNSYRKQILYK